MTDRPDGTPDEDELPEAEAAEATALDTIDESGEEPEPSEEPEASEELEPGQEPEDQPVDAEEGADAGSITDDETVAVDAAGRPVAVPGRPHGRRGAPVPVATRAPSASEVAVHVGDRASTIFVIGTVVVFLAILGYGIFLGHGGILTGTPTPRPTAVPTASPTAAPSASGSVAPSSSASAAPSASTSASPSASIAPSASASASVAPSASGAPSASPSPS